MTVLATDVPKATMIPARCPRPLKPVRVAVVGLGREGVVHAAVLSSVPDCELVAVADPRPAARRNVRGMGCPAPGYPSLEKLLARVAPDAVVVCVPPDRRAAVARAALEGGAAVLIEPPFACSAAEAEPLVRLAAEKGLALGCAHRLAFRAVFAHAQRVIGGGALGAVRQVRSSLYLSRVFSPAQKRLVLPEGAPGGVLALAATDLLFLLTWYFGPPVEVRATSVKLYGEPEDELHAMMRLASGAEVGFDTSWSVPGYPSDAVVVELEAENGKLLASDDALELELIEAHHGLPAGYTRLGREDLPQPARFDLGGETQYLQDAAFLEWVTGGAAPPSNGEAALAVLRVVDALYASARDGGRRVEVSA
jgi:predicted dehydrogenase